MANVGFTVNNLLSGVSGKDCRFLSGQNDLVYSSGSGLIAGALLEWVLPFDAIVLKGMLAVIVTDGESSGSNLTDVKVGYLDSDDALQGLTANNLDGPTHTTGRQTFDMDATDKTLILPAGTIVQIVVSSGDATAMSRSFGSLAVLPVFSN